MKLLKSSIVKLFLVSAIYFSCNSNYNDNQLFIVKKTNYISSIKVAGSLESKNSINISCPRLRADLKVKYLIEDGSTVQTGDTVCILDAPEVESKYLDALKELEIAKIEYKKSLQNVRLQILLLESQVESIETSTEISRLDSLQTLYSSETRRKITELEIQKAELEKEKLENKLKFLKEITKSELEKVKLKITQSKNKVNRQKEVLDKLVITSKNGGIVVRERSWSTGRKLEKGDVVWGRQPLLTIPDLSVMQVKLVTNEADAKRIAKKQRVKVRVDAFPEVILTGKIKKKSGAGKAIERGSKVKVYEAIASIDSLPRALMPGLNVSANVILEEIHDTITVPITSLFDSDSAKIVYLKSGNKFIPKEVSVAKFSTTQAVISNGLKENDIISTYKPHSKQLQ